MMKKVNCYVYEDIIDAVSPSGYFGEAMLFESEGGRMPLKLFAEALLAMFAFFSSRSPYMLIKQIDWRSADWVLRILVSLLRHDLVILFCCCLPSAPSFLSNQAFQQNSYNGKETLNLLLAVLTSWQAHPHPRRDFTPSKAARYGRPTFDPDKLVKYSPKHRICRLMNFPFRGSHYRPRMRSVVVAVDGASRGNDSSNPVSRGACGVSWGKDSGFNQCHKLPTYEAQTSNRAELQAVNQALILYGGRRASGELDGWRELIIKLDSDYVKKCFDEYIWMWEQNGWRKSDGGEIKHLNLIQEIHRRICDLERNGAVRFWRVDRKWNQDADALANQALDM